MDDLGRCGLRARRPLGFRRAAVDPAGDDPLDLAFLRSADGGSTWSAPLRINDDPAGNGAFQWLGTHVPDSCAGAGGGGELRLTGPVPGRAGVRNQLTVTGAARGGTVRFFPP